MITDFDIDEESVRSAREESVIALKALREGNKIINQNIRKPSSKLNANTTNNDRNEKSVNFFESKEKKINRSKIINNIQSKKASHVVNVKEDLATNIRVPTLLKSPLIFYENALNTFEDVSKNCSNAKNNNISIHPHLVNPEHSANDQRDDDSYRSKKTEPISNLTPNLYSWLAKEENIRSHSYAPLLPSTTKEMTQSPSPRMDIGNDRNKDTIISESNERFRWQVAEEQPKRAIRSNQNPITLDNHFMDPFQHMLKHHSLKSHELQGNNNNNMNANNSSRHFPQYGLPYDDKAVIAAGVSTGATSQMPPPSFFAWNIPSDYQINQSTKPHSSTTTQTDLLHTLSSQYQQSTVSPKVEVGIQTTNLPPPPPPSISQQKQEVQIIQEPNNLTRKTNPVMFTTKQEKSTVSSPTPTKQLLTSKLTKTKNILSDYPSISSHTLNKQNFTKGMPFDKRVMTRSVSAPSLLTLRTQSRQLSQATISRPHNSSYIKERSWKALGGWGLPPPPPPARLQGRKVLDTREITSNYAEYWDSETPSAIDSTRDRYEPSEDASGGSASFGSAPLLDKLSRWSPTPDHIHYDPNRDYNNNCSSMRGGGGGGGLSRPFSEEGTVSDVSHSISTTSSTRQIESAARAMKLADEVRKKDRQKAFYETTSPSNHIDDKRRGEQDVYTSHQKGYSNYKDTKNNYNQNPNLYKDTLKDTGGLREQQSDSLNNDPKTQHQQNTHEWHSNNKRPSAEDVSHVATADSSTLWEDTFSSSTNNNHSRSNNRKRHVGGSNQRVQPADPRRPWQQATAHRNDSDDHTSMAMVRSIDQDVGGSVRSGRGSSTAWMSTTSTATDSDRTPSEHRHRRRVGLADFHRAKVPLDQPRSSYHRKLKVSPGVHWLDHPTSIVNGSGNLRPKSAPVGRRKMSTVEGKYGWSQYQKRYPLESEQQTRRWKSETANQFNKKALIDRSLHLDC